MMQGTIPQELCGTLLRNGPGNFDFGSQQLNHPFDGDGLVWSFAFKDGQVLVRRKYVRTKAFKAEMAAGALRKCISSLFSRRMSTSERTFWAADTLSQAVRTLDGCTMSH
jgi:carotenoid cleavage dioxygenase-like enzyme